MITDHRPRSRSRFSFLGLRVLAVVGIAMGVGSIVLMGISMGSMWQQSTARDYFVKNDLAPPPQNNVVKRESLWTLVKLRQWEQRSVADGYWDALNRLDANTALSYLEDGYSAEAEADLRRVEQIVRSGGPITVTEVREPFMTNADEAAMFFTLGDPPDEERVLMTFIRHGDGWRIRSTSPAP